MNDQEFHTELSEALTSLAEGEPVENRWSEVSDAVSRRHGGFGSTGRLAVAAAVVMAVLGWVTLGNIGDELTTIDAVEDGDSVPALLGSDGELCLSDLEAFAVFAPDDVVVELRPILDDDTPIVRRFDHTDSGVTTVVLISGEAVVSCDIPVDAVDPGATRGFAFGRVRQDPLVSRGIKVAIEQWTSSGEGEGIGPGVSVVIGRVGDEIEAVLLEHADGSTATAAIDRGWFSIRAQVPEGVDVFDQQLKLVFDEEPSQVDDSPSELRTAAPASQTRWFLAPADAQIEFIDGRNWLWSNAQEVFNERNVVVTTDRANQAGAGLAWVYYLDGITIDLTNGPEEFSETFRDVGIDGRMVRVGSDADIGTVRAFVQAASGIIALSGSGITEADAIDAVTATEVIDGTIVLDDADLTSLSIVEHPAAAPTDHATSLGWNTPQGEARLVLSPGTLSSAQLNSGSQFQGQPTTVRGLPAAFFADIPNQNPATLVWAEDGYQVALSIGSDGEGHQLDDLSAVADGLMRVQQPELVERFQDEFMNGQPATIAAWLDDATLPPGWDPAPFVHGVPSGEYDTANFLRQFLSCAWGAEWLDAFEAGDDQRRQNAYDALRRRSQWDLVAAEHAAFAELVDTEDDHAAQLAASFDADLHALDALVANPRENPASNNLFCGFRTPNGN